MEYVCVVFGCRNSITSLQEKKINCKFFNFPLDSKDLTDQWLRKLYLEGWTPGPESFICEEHFSLDSFDILEKEKVLKPGSIPNLVDEWHQIIMQNQNGLESDGNIDESDSTQKYELRCRICATFISSNHAINIYSEDEKVIEKMMACIPILMKSEDNLPKHICRLCLSDLNISYRMLVRAIESEKLFNSLLSKLEEKPTDENLDVDIGRTWDVHETEIVCVMCNVHLEDIDDLTKHLQEKHGQDFDFTDHANETEVEHTDADLFELDGDNFSDTKIKENNESLKRDTLSIQESNIQATCNVCGMSFASYEDLNFHVEDVHKLDDSKAETILVEDSDHEYVQEEESTLFLCPVCLTGYESVELLNKHIETHIESVVLDADDEEKVDCTETPAKYNGKHSCPNCAEVFLTVEQLTQHCRKAHRQKQSKDEATVHKHGCKYCGKEFLAKISLAAHERVHTGDRPFVCKSCGKGFRSRANLFQHDLVHSGVKRHKCSICDKAFARKAFVVTHMRVHTGERPFECDVCGNRYTQIGDVRRHKKRHLIPKAPNRTRFVAVDQYILAVDESSTVAAVDAPEPLFKLIQSPVSEDMLKPAAFIATPQPVRSLPIQLTNGKNSFADDYEVVVPFIPSKKLHFPKSAASNYRQMQVQLQ